MSGLTASLHLTPHASGDRRPSRQARPEHSRGAGDDRLDVGCAEGRLSAAAKRAPVKPIPLPDASASRPGRPGTASNREAIDATLEFAERIGSRRTAWNFTSFAAASVGDSGPDSLSPGSAPGDIFVSPKEVVLRDLRATHGQCPRSPFPARASLGQQQAWDMKISAENLAVDESILTALPDSIATVLRGLKVGGNIGLDLSKLAYWPTGQTAATRPDRRRADVDFAAKITMQGASRGRRPARHKHAGRHRSRRPGAQAAIFTASRANARSIRCS